MCHHLRKGVSQKEGDEKGVKQPEQQKKAETGLRGAWAHLQQKKKKKKKKKSELTANPSCRASLSYRNRMPKSR